MAEWAPRRPSYPRFRRRRGRCHPALWPLPKGCDFRLCRGRRDRNAHVPPCLAVPGQLRRPAAQDGPSGAFAYILKREDSYGLWIVDYRVDEGTGALTEMGRVKLFGNYPGRLFVDPSERFVYASAEPDGGQGRLSVLRITP